MSAASVGDAQARRPARDLAPEEEMQRTVAALAALNQFTNSTWPRKIWPRRSQQL